MYKFISHSEDETKQFAYKLASRLNIGDIILLVGDLGAGKTKFTEGLLSFWNLQDEISSPTFTIVNEYNTQNINIYHFDVYRIGSSDEMYDIGYDDYINGEGVCIIEWANLIEDILPDECLYIELKYKDMSREMILNPVGEKYEKIVEELTK